jgi:cytoskeletal protein RodZ
MAREGGVAAFGEELRRAREERGVALEAICEATKVPARYIRALEAGALGELPGGVFRRGFVRSYLGALGLEEGAWMRRFEESCREDGVSEPADAEWATFAENVKKSRIVLRRRMGMRWVGWGVVLLALALAGWCGWRLATHRGLLPANPISRVLKSSVNNAPPPGNLLFARLKLSVRLR